jgi:hypothetical protein
LGHQVERIRASNERTAHNGLGKLERGGHGQKGIESARKATANAQVPEAFSDSPVEPVYKALSFSANTANKQTDAKVGQIASCKSDIVSQLANAQNTGRTDKMSQPLRRHLWVINEICYFHCWIACPLLDIAPFSEESL